MAINTTISTNADIGGGKKQTYLNKTYYDRNLLENAKTKLVHAEYGQKRSIPKNNGKTVEFRKWVPLTPDLSLNDPTASGAKNPGGMKLVEGVTPAGQSLSQTNVTATVDQYGAYYEVSDMLKTTAFDDIAEGATDLLGEALGVAVDWVTRNAMAQTTNRQYANGKASGGRSSIAATDVLNTTEIRKAVRTLKKQKARMFTRSGGKQHFIAIVSPDSVYDLQNDPLWQDVSKYSNAEQIYSGEIGRIFGVVFIESTEAMVYTGAGASSADVHCTMVFGKDAYGTIDIEGSGNVHTIIKPAGSAGTADPLDQRATIGGKVDAYTAVVLCPEHLVAIEHGVTA